MLLGDCHRALQTADLSDLDRLQATLELCQRAVLDPQLWLWLGLFTLVSAVAGALLGLVRGRWLLGLALGVALGPLGWLVILLLPADFVECPRCSFRNSPRRDRCRHCGESLAAGAPRSERAERRRLDGGRGWS